jgi:predicted dehydrogenase
MFQRRPLPGYSSPVASPSDSLRIALIGTAFMGRAHSQAWQTAPRFFELPVGVELAVIVGNDPVRTEHAARTFGWREASTDWRSVVERDDIDVVDICTPGDTHAEIALAALAAGKHVLCEKPLANSVAEAERMARAASEAAHHGIRSMCGFSYRRTPALALARQLIADGRVGTIRHIRAQYLQDWLSDASAPMTWRLDREKAGSGALGDIAAHSIDLAQWLSGDRITGVSATMRTFVDERPVMAERSGLSGSADAAGATAQVTVDDAVAFTASFAGGALGVFEATRMALGRRNANRIEINGDRGSVAFDFERMNELEFYERDGDRATAGFRRIQVSDDVHPYTAHWWPAGHGLGYEHLFTHQAADFVQAIASGTDPSPGFAEAVGVQRVLAAVESSARDGSRWFSIPAAGADGEAS